jgi:hypothetical protein
MEKISLKRLSQKLEVAGIYTRGTERVTRDGKRLAEQMSKLTWGWKRLA